MRYLKLFENYNREDIDSICKKYNIKNYTINDDGSIDIDGNVDLYNKGLTELPLRFRNVSRHFTCTYNNITSLIGCPESIRVHFDCSYNELTSLLGCPKSIGGELNCSANNIRTLEGFPINLGGNFNCYDNPVYKLWKLFKDKDKVELFNDFGITDGEVVILDRLNEFLEMIGKPIVTDPSRLDKKGYRII